MLMWVAWRVETCAHVYRHARTQVHSHTMRTHTHTHTHTYTHTHTHTYTHTHTHTISQITQQAASMLYQKKALILKKIPHCCCKICILVLYSYHLATLPFSRKFNFDELSKYDKIC